MGAIVGGDCWAIVGATIARPFDSFWGPHFDTFCRTVCKLAPHRGTKTASKMMPLYNTLTLWRPPRGPPRAAPTGRCLFRVSIPFPGGERRLLPANFHERPDRARSGGRGHLRKTASSRKWGPCSRFVRCGLKVELRAAAGEPSVSKRAPANRVPRGCVQRGREKGQECKGDGGKAGRENMEIHTISGRTYDQDS